MFFEYADFLTVGFINHIDNFFGEVRPFIHHSKQYPANIKIRVDKSADLRYTRKQQFQAFSVKVLWAYGDNGE